MDESEVRWRLEASRGRAPEGAIARRPVVDGPWRRICGMPDLGGLAGPEPRHQHIVDHGFIRARSGAWQLWACIRGTAAGRLIYGWEGDSLGAGPWAPRGVKVRARAECGEIVEPQEKVGAPFFLERDGRYWCLYHSAGVHAMVSDDGVNYERVRDDKGSSCLLRDGGRDVMVMRSRGLYFLYLTVTTSSREDWRTSFVIARTTRDFRQWSDPTVVSAGGAAGSGPVNAESPFVVELDGWFYLFRATSIDPMTFVYRSVSPWDFGVDDDSKLIAVLPIKAPELVRHDGRWYITDLADFQGVRIAPLRWEEDA
jgi:hypothetical protein